MQALLMWLFLVLSVVLVVVGYRGAKRNKYIVFYNYVDVFVSFVFALFTLFVTSGFLQGAIKLQGQGWAILSSISGVIVLILLVSSYNLFMAWKSNKQLKWYKIILVFGIRILSSCLIAGCALSLVKSIFPEKDEHSNYITQMFTILGLVWALKKLSGTFINAKRIIPEVIK